MNPSLYIYLGHDSNLSIYCPLQDKIFAVELEKILDIKHLHSYRTSMKDLLRAVIRAIDLLGFNYSTFDQVVINTYIDEPSSVGLLACLRRELTAKAFILNKSKHHDLHAYSGYIQSGYKKAVVLSIDGEGSAECTTLHVIKNGKRTKRVNLPLVVGHLYWYFSRCPKELENTPDLMDLPGKLMGLAAYGTRYANQQSVIDGIKKDATINLGAIKAETGKSSKSIVFDIGKKFTKLEKDTAFQLDKEKGRRLARLAQDFVEDTFLDILSKYVKDIEDCDNNLVICGGVALNVLANSRVRDKWPHWNIYVPSNPHDGGLSVGLAAIYNINTLNIGKSYDTTFTGVPLQEVFPPIGRDITTSEIAYALQQKMIIGLVQGPCENGPRALGNRSILASAAPGMIDIINLKIKKREPFRPFAPIVREEDASIYFDAPHFNNCYNMTFVANVKKDKVAEIPSVTHVDGTARVQIVQKETNPILHEILTKYGGVLINTSFNEGGKPTLNTSSAAFNILRFTELDAIVYLNSNNVLKLVTKQDLK